MKLRTEDVQYQTLTLLEYQEVKIKFTKKNSAQIEYVRKARMVVRMWN